MPSPPIEQEHPPLPDVGRVSVELARRQARTISHLLIRIVLLSILVAVVCRQSSAARQYSGVLDAVGGVFILWPFFTATGRIYATRIGVGRTFAAHERWNEVVQMLCCFAGGPRSRLFDATGEGRYLLAQAWSELGRADRAHPLFARLAAEIGDRTEFGRLAAQATGAVAIGDALVTVSERKAASQ